MVSFKESLPKNTNSGLTVSSKYCTNAVVNGFHSFT